MPIVRFQVRPHPAGPTALPLKIRRGDLTVAGRALSNESIELDNDVYFVSTPSPVGEQLLARLVVAGQDQTVELKPESVRDGSPTFNVRAAPRASIDDMQTYIRIFTGNPLKDEIHPAAPGDALSPLPSDPGRGPQYKLRNASRGIAFVQVLRPGQPVMNVAIPAAPGDKANLFVCSHAGDGAPVELQLENQTAVELLSYMGSSDWKGAEGKTQSAALDAERLLEAKGKDPIAATASGYALLRLGALDRLHDWTKNLCDWFDWLPDGAAIRGEHLARLGRHEEAAEEFMKVPERGLPVFYDGLASTLSRLRLYTQAYQGLALDVERAKAAIACMDPFLLYADLRSLLLAYPGLDPSRPSRGAVESAEDVPADFVALQSRRSP